MIVAALLMSYSLAPFAHDDADHRANYRHHRVLRVFDANGKVVGAFRYSGGGAGVFVTVNGASVFLPVVRRQVSGTGDQTVYSASQFSWGLYFINQYFSADCSGAPLIVSNAGPRPSSVLRTGSEVTVYVAPASNSQFLSVSSYLLGSAGQCQRYATPLTQAGWPVESSYVITQDHPEPLTVHY
ncbi:hypothetical protein [Caballeronia sp. Lep1P3]|uniref:hypothetical protein n=1 Tax=Caballeronia sp. Lep1P3 TaxID=2878150 RepID=UPI001FD20D30|nr:hypothetical protein [Caballeronia sp. Lep1P3]